MRLLINTHILIWADQPPRLIVQPLPATMRDETNELVVSAASMWEIAVKWAIGKLRFDRPIVATLLALGFEILAVTGSHAEHAGGLPRHHVIRSIVRHDRGSGRSKIRSAERRGENVTRNR